MKVSYSWLAQYFEKSLPQKAELSDALTFHVAEVEELAENYIDVKVLPDRAAYMLSHRGVAFELGAILNQPLQEDPLRTSVPEWPTTQELSVEVDSTYVIRHLGALVKGITVGPSPAWLKEALESVGQRSINNIVDATNYVMLNIGQPLHAFDAGTISRDGEVLRITIREANEGEEITVLTGETYTLTKGMYVIADATSGKALDIAGLKGGAASGITERTTDLFISVGTYDGSLIRKMSQNLKLWTDASQRYQNKISPTLGAYGLRDILVLIEQLAGGELVGVVDVYPAPEEQKPVTVSLAQINGRLGSSFTLDEVRVIFDRLNFTHSEAESVFTVLAPFERRDIVIPEDVAEEVARISGYETIPSTELPGVPALPSLARYQGLERVRDFLVERGYLEVSSQSFGTEGEIELANPLQQDRPWLRASLLSNMHDALTRGAQVAPRVLGPAPLLKLCEVGSVFTKTGELTLVAFGVRALTGKGAEEVLKENVATFEQELLGTAGKAHFSLDASVVEIVLTDEELVKLGEGYEPKLAPRGAYQPFSVYPFALRDIAVWTPAGTTQDQVEGLIRSEAGPLLVRLDLFDTFEKEGRISYAFRLVFESPTMTLSDTELVPVMETITKTLNGTSGFEVR